MNYFEKLFKKSVRVAKFITIVLVLLIALIFGNAVKDSIAINKNVEKLEKNKGDFDLNYVGNIRK